MRVCFYSPKDKREKHKDAQEQYDEEIWDSLSTFRNQISRARRLSSEAAYRRFVSLYDDITELDQNLTGLINNTSDDYRFPTFQEVQEYIRWQLTVKIDQELDFLASELHLKEEKREMDRAIPARP